MKLIALVDQEQGPYKKGDIFEAADDRVEDIEATGAARKATPEEVDAWEEKQRSRAGSPDAAADAEAREKYEGMTVDELKDELADRDLPTSGNKADLVDRLVEADRKA